MNSALAHRGPNDAGVYLSPQKTVGLGHRRLSVIDLSQAGHQPMRYLDRYVITFNGEIYNYPELRQKLLNDGHPFKSTTDTEVILALYATYGSRCVEYLNGMFAFAIYDEQDDTVFCARDRLGKKPFKYYYDKHVFIFASEIKALLTQREVPRDPDLASLNQYLTLQYVPAPHTGFLNIWKLPPAHTLTIDRPTKKVIIKQYWNPPRPDIQESRTEAQWAEALRSAVTEAVQCRLIADVPLGAFLSGGVDSSAIVALMAQASPHPIKTFSISFTDASHDETAYARLVSERYYTDHTEFTVKPDPQEIMSLLQHSFDEPFGDSSAVPTYYVCRQARRVVTVALTGDGGDELFAGYRHYAAHRVAEQIARIPGTRAVGSRLATHLSVRAGRFAVSLAQPPFERHLTFIAYFTPAMKRDLFTPTFAHYLSDPISATSFMSGDPVTAAVAYDTATYLPDDILTKVDIMSMAVGLEARSPLLDQNVVELAASIPTFLKLKGFTGKYIWKQAIHDLVPTAILKRRKHGFTVPISAWLRGPLDELVTATLLGSASKRRGLFQPAHLERLIETHRKGDQSLARPLWALLTLELWFQTYIDQP